VFLEQANFRSSHQTRLQAGKTYLLWAPAGMEMVWASRPSGRRNSTQLWLLTLRKVSGPQTTGPEATGAGFGASPQSEFCEPVPDALRRLGTPLLRGLTAWFYAYLREISGLALEGD